MELGEHCKLLETSERNKLLHALVQDTHRAVRGDLPVAFGRSSKVGKTRGKLRITLQSRAPIAERSVRDSVLLASFPIRRPRGIKDGLDSLGSVKYGIGHR